MRAMLFASVLLVGAASCHRREPIRMVQFCLAGPQDISELEGLVRTAAVANDLQFEGGSTEAGSEAESTATGHNKVRIAQPTVSIGASAPGGRGFTAVNLPEAPLQIVVDFSKAGNPTDARNLYHSVVRTLAKHWRIHERPEQRSLSPLKDC